MPTITTIIAKYFNRLIGCLPTNSKSAEILDSSFQISTEPLVIKKSQGQKALGIASADSYEIDIINNDFRAYARVTTYRKFYRAII